MTFQLLVQVWLIFSQEHLKGSTGGGYVVIFKAENFAKEGIAQDYVAEDVEGFYFPKDGNEDYGWVSHTLHVAHVWSKKMKKLKELANFKN